MEGEDKEEIDEDNKGGTKKLIDIERESPCVWRGEIKRQRRRYGGIYRYRWGEGGEGRRFLVVDELISV